MRDRGGENLSEWKCERGRKSSEICMQRGREKSIGLTNEKKKSRDIETDREISRYS